METSASFEARSAPLSYPTLEPRAASDSGSHDIRAALRSYFGSWAINTLIQKSNDASSFAATAA